MRVAPYTLVVALALAGCAGPAASTPGAGDGPSPSFPDAATTSVTTAALDPVSAGGTRWATLTSVSTAGDKVSFKVTFGDQVSATNVADLGPACAVSDASLRRGLALPISVTVTVHTSMPVDLSPEVLVTGGSGADLLVFYPDARGGECTVGRAEMSVSLQPGGSAASTFWVVAGDVVTPNDPAGDRTKLGSIGLDLLTGSPGDTVTWAGPLATGCTDGAPAVSEAGTKC